MNSYRLRKDEIVYELSIRGVSTAGDTNDLRKRLTQCFSNKTAIDNAVVNGLDELKELETCEEKLSDLAFLIEAYDGDYKDSEALRLTARLWHLFYRVERIPIAPSSDLSPTQRQQELLDKTKEFIDLFQGTGCEKKEDPLKSVNPPETNHGLGNNIQEISTPVRSTDVSFSEISKQTPLVDDLHTLHDQMQEITLNPSRAIKEIPSKHQGYGPKSVPVYKWNLKFNNDGAVSIGAFLVRVEELRRARGVSEQELFESAVDLFAGQALIWYRSAHQRVSSWKELCKELKSVFQNPDYDDWLLQEIKERTQGEEEAIDLYLAAMEGLYSRLNEGVTEKEKLKQVLKNLNGFLQSKLCLVKITSMEDLRYFGRQAEAGRMRAMRQRPPPKSNQVLEPDLAYSVPPYRSNGVRKPFSNPGRISTISDSNRNIPNNNRSELNSRRPQMLDDSTMLCWNCQKTGHRFTNCNLPRKKFCYTCGTHGVSKVNCNKCRPKNV